MNLAKWCVVIFTTTALISIILEFVILDAIEDKDKKLEEIPVIREVILAESTLVAAYNLFPYEAKIYSFIFADLGYRYKYDWTLFAATLYIESAFKPRQISPAGAKGKMQLLESTMEEQCKLLGYKHERDYTIWDDFKNVHCGVNYLMIGIDKDGYEYGIKRYVGGPKYKDSKNQDYVNSYYNLISSEHRRLHYIRDGIMFSLSQLK